VQRLSQIAASGMDEAQQMMAAGVPRRTFERFCAERARAVRITSRMAFERARAEIIGCARFCRHLPAPEAGQ